MFRLLSVTSAKKAFPRENIKFEQLVTGIHFIYGVIHPLQQSH